MRFDLIRIRSRENFFRHGLRRATFLKEEGFGFPRSPNLSLPLGEMSRSDRENWLLLSVLPLHRGLA